ncbi:unnamed protein product [Vitrella brassicaformis CCMP3155]|uniref:RING-type domain-containing protein n=1 Tax=Vitrella brassicaformis (strain CCMP3155) TaxID=1169540 RepID=A0A0G4EF17_VITBC|nr:unnamed protein product [Vitrella brassicaformis CCMP3155]|eukprot:CEL93991.1 unnamed protein product [Vitrella brassicaformis CCMP3155]
MEDLPPGAHNTLVIALIVFVVLWITKITIQTLRLFELHQKILTQEALYLDGMSSYAKDFQRLVRAHFNQILRMRRTVPPTTVPRVSVFVAVDAASLRVVSDTSPGHGARVGVQFRFDASVPCSITLYWGASLHLLHRLLKVVEEPPESASERERAASRTALRNLLYLSSIRVDQPTTPPPTQGPMAALGTGVTNGLRLLGQRGRPAQAADSTRSLLEMEEIDASNNGGNASASSASSQAERDQPTWFANGKYVDKSREAFFQSGAGQLYETPPAEMIDYSTLRAMDTFAVAAPSGGAGASSAAAAEATTPSDTTNQDLQVPLVIIATGQRSRATSASLGSIGGVPIAEGYCQVTVVRFKPGEDPNVPAAEVVRQVVLCSRVGNGAMGGDGGPLGPLGPQEAKDIYGLEDEHDRDCLICMANPKDAMLLPCRHCTLCYCCLRSLRQERCPLCRVNFSSFITFPIRKDPTPRRGGSGSSNNSPSNRPDRGNPPQPPGGNNGGGGDDRSCGPPGPPGGSPGRRPDGGGGGGGSGGDRRQRDSTNRSGGGLMGRLRALTGQRHDDEASVSGGGFLGVNLGLFHSLPGISGSWGGGATGNSSDVTPLLNHGAPSAPMSSPAVADRSTADILAARPPHAPTINVELGGLLSSSRPDSKKAHEGGGLGMATGASGAAMNGGVYTQATASGSGSGGASDEELYEDAEEADDVEEGMGVRLLSHAAAAAPAPAPATGTATAGDGRRKVVKEEACGGGGRAILMSGRDVV